MNIQYTNAAIRKDGSICVNNLIESKRQIVAYRPFTYAKSLLTRFSARNIFDFAAIFIVGTDVVDFLATLSAYLGKFVFFLNSKETATDKVGCNARR